MFLPPALPTHLRICIGALQRVSVILSSFIHHNNNYNNHQPTRYTYRYGREHGCEAHIVWLTEHEPEIPHPATNRGIDVAGFRVLADPPCAMPVEFKVGLCPLLQFYHCCNLTPLEGNRRNVCGRFFRRRRADRSGIHLLSLDLSIVS